ncbi:MAG: deoxyguanosinetriphosphate triphosphohydrolase, partial [Solirubrobacterales bacterium]|nr:deoxyguanosinetriphosphate triphosphohydrolase [Solirubrobacterales bacterium]
GGTFRHNEQSLRVVDVLERDGRGLNLSRPVREGILHHSWHAPPPSTLEGAIVRYADRVTYINHDIDDALRAGVIAVEDLPADAIAVLGDSGPRRIDALVHDLVEHSEPAGEIVQGQAAAVAMAAVREFMFDRVYLGAEARREHAKIELVIRSLFDHYCAAPGEIPDTIPDGSLQQRVTDYLAGMTDRFCIRAFEGLSVPVAFAS